jgi:hypothetical protein
MAWRKRRREEEEEEEEEVEDGTCYLEAQTSFRKLRYGRYWLTKTTTEVGQDTDITCTLKLIKEGNYDIIETKAKFDPEKVRGRPQRRNNRAAHLRNFGNISTTRRTRSEERSGSGTSRISENEDHSSTASIDLTEQGGHEENNENDSESSPFKTYAELLLMNEGRDSSPIRTCGDSTLKNDDQD